ncbi:MAG: hypothetical protein IE878_06105 [Epsilonproteobacteria bacterium]|nr:hypothetical protein [Campylobacterota bacterium]
MLGKIFGYSFSYNELAKYNFLFSSKLGKTTIYIATNDIKNRLTQE